MARARWAILAPALVVGLTLLASLGAAHNPALTAYEPVRLGDGLLVLGEEGTAALLTLDGEQRWLEKLEVQIVQAPTTGHGLGVAYARDLSTVESYAVAFDQDGVAWQTGLEETSAAGWVLPTEEGFAAISAAGNLTLIDDQGQVISTHELPLAPAAAPAAHPDGGWILADRQGNLAIVEPEGRPVDAVQLDARAWTMTTIPAGDQVVVGYGSVSDDQAGLLALSPGLEEVWRQAVPGFRAAGIAVLDDGQIAVGTYRSQGAHVALVTSQGELTWDHALEGPTAAAVATDGQGLYVTTNDAILALGADGSERWTAEVDPRLTPATVTDGLVIPSGADNRLVALEASTGQVAWTWDDGVREVPWTDEQLAQEGGIEQGDDAGGPSPIPVGPLLALAALGAGALLQGRR